MADLPLVSVVIPSYNHAKYVDRAIQSVLTQTYQNLELIIVDDGSCDDSHEVIRAYKDDSRVKIILNDINKGQSYAFNQALSLVKGEFICLLPSDDWYLPKKIELQVAKFKQCPESVGVVYCSGSRYYEDTGETHSVSLPVHTGWIAEALIREGNFVYPITPMFRRNVFDCVRMNEGFRAEGEAVYLRIALKFEFEYVDECLAVMRDHTYNIGKDVEVMYDEISRYWSWFFNLPDLPDNIRRLKPVALERLNRIKGMQFIGDKRDFKKGRRCLARAFFYNISLLSRPKLVGAFVVSLMPVSVANVLLDWIRYKRRSASV